MSFQQLDPPIPVHVLERGPGLAFAVIDYGPEHNLIWVTALDANGEIWCAPNPKVRMQGNWTMGRARPAAVAAERDACTGDGAIAA
ncbi:hypothetical protein COC42_05160 [Sphingomonas spermidinifaciens]|uniref:Uncharacterized protein n=1 Tax=Sphingomonas spermidinifaciens TaxID=1141889 RepID=A0A2A4B5M6_9SPHN|nr:hypothetical protein [Sphingomonas spermidinifaciens]PCD03741.1 hypothetical protein COC42_05160 [Sphingomonas spermidinifaciens]